MSNLFLGVRGQDKAVSVLSAQLKSDNLSHAYLFLGKEGSGKEYLARVFSRYILCGSKTEDDCNSCNKFKKNVHPDFIFIDGVDGIKIENIRKSIERINLSPNLSAKKVLLITNVENMSIEAANALLKTLEEPPVDSVIVLSAITEKSLPETIVSRSQSIKLNTLSKNDIKEILANDFNSEDLDIIIELAGNSINKAKEMVGNKDTLKLNKELFEDAERIHSSQSIIEKFKIIEKYDKNKKIKGFFDVYARYIFGEIFEKTQLGEGAKGELETGKEILKVYSNLNYNVSLRISLEKIILKEQLSG